MKMTGHTIRLEGQRSHSLSLPVHERVIAQEVFGDGEKWSRIHAACAHPLSEKRVSLWSESRENSHLPVSCHTYAHLETEI